ncbi:MAG: RnfABCDGE type electron transport complex subunit D [Bacteroidales bacterium]
MDKKLLVALSPHVSGEYSTQKLMYGVLIALLPAFLLSVWFFGYSALLVTAVSVAACVLTEYLVQKYILKVPATINDGSAAVTGVLLAFNIPSNLPVWMIVIGAVVSIAIVKHTFGGLGNNFMNPALVGRVFMLISFPVQMTSWPLPKGFSTSYTDAITGATPLGILKEGVKAGDQVSQLMSSTGMPSYTDLFIGNMGGSLGEIAAGALILGFLYLLWKRIITWHIPVTIVATVAVFTGILWQVDPTRYADPLFHILSGGLLLGAIFMATDYVTSPMTIKGMLIYSVGIGILTVLIRVWGAYPEGVSFAILIMNAFTPLINRYFKPKRFGEVVKHG